MLKTSGVFDPSPLIDCILFSVPRLMAQFFLLFLLIISFCLRDALQLDMTCK
jgi:hypothetical protein